MGYSIAHINEIAGGRLISGGIDANIEHLLLDSRRLIFPATSLFFALKGPRRTGDQFIMELFKRGVRNFVLEKELDLPGANQLIVGDTLAALQKLAAAHRRQFTIPVIGITGSNGKTIIKEWLNQLLEEDYHIVRSPKSYNSQTGVPLSVWQLGPQHQLAIFEAGISRRGEMERLEPIIRPTIGIFTNIGEAHSEGFSSLQEKAAEKMRLFAHAGTLVYCSDQPIVSTTVPDGPDRFAWGQGTDAQMRISSMEKKETWTTVAITHAAATFSFTIPFTDPASIGNALHCVAVLLLLGRSPEQIQTRLARLAPIAMRLELKSGINHCSIINDKL